MLPYFQRLQALHSGGQLTAQEYAKMREKLLQKVVDKGAGERFYL